MKQLSVLSFLFVFLVALFGLPLLSAVVPFGASASPNENQTAPADSAGSHAAIAGNVTDIDLTAYTTTQSWQGYYGNVSGTIQLADASDNVLYNWSLASPEGEVYAANSSAVTWTNIQCLNFSAAGTFADDSANRGGTSQYGLNLAQIEAWYGIASDDVDGFNETFDTDGSLPGNDGTHDLFYANNLQFADGECLSANIFRQGSGQDDYFEEVLLYDPDNVVPIFTALLEEIDTAGFDGAYHDFQLIVPENGHGVDVSTTTYYFYVELE